MTNSKYFKNSKKWDASDLKNIGLPRPFAIPNRKDLAKKVPVPWQSEDRFEEIGHLKLNVENEFIIYKNNLCPYCGIKIKNKETVIRWITSDLELIHGGNQTVYSDIHPFHLECMNQARIFCPHMRTLSDIDFEVGFFKKLKNNANKDVERSKKIKNEKTTKKDF